MSWVWLLDPATAVGAGTKVFLGALTLSNPGIGETVLRTRGRVSVDAVAGVKPQGAFGMIVINDLALAAGAASIPGPVTDGPDDGWFVWESFQFTATAERLSYEFEFDSRARRRTEEGFGLAVMVESAAAAFNITSSISLLSRLS